MDLSAVNSTMVINMLVLLLIGMGPKIALVPFLEKTKGMDSATKRRIGTKMVITAVVTALVLLALGAVLMRLLHISAPSVAIAGGIVLLLLALKMAAGPTGEHPAERPASPIDPEQIAIYPLAIPYLLNPVGIVILIVASAEAQLVAVYAIVAALVIVIGAIDLLIFRNIDVLAKRLSPSNLVISEVVFGILLTAIAIELMYSGLVRYGIVEKLVAH